MSTEKSRGEQEKKAFEDSIFAGRFDGDLRKVFADWLEENGYDDEAVYQRTWTPERQRAEDWLGDYAREVELSYDELIDAAHLFLETGDTHCLGFDTPDIVWEGAEEFWGHFATATGESVGNEVQGQTFFRCAC